MLYPDLFIGASPIAQSLARDYCGWHIAPVVTETVRLDSDGSELLRLPTLRLVSVASVTTKDESPVTGWEWSANGYLRKPGGFPRGLGAVTVTFEHGYDEAPAHLQLVLSVLEKSARAGGQVVQESLAGRSITLETASGTVGAAAALSRYRLGPHP